MENMEEMESQEALIYCCQCRTLISPNPANMCVACIRKDVDITEGIPKQGIIYQCKGCERWLNPPDRWVNCTLESRELLALCLKKLKGLNRVRLVEAAFEWTEPHSRRIKVKLVIQKEVMAGAILEQRFLVEYTVNTQMCEDCHRSEAKDYWRALVQIRQKVEHKKTLYYMEQLILKHRAHQSATGIKPKNDGLDFFYDHKQHARKMVDFLMGVVPCRYITAQQLISHDTHSNTYNYKHTFSVEIVPICKDNIVCLSAKLARSLGGINPICICSQVSEQIHLLDPTTAQIAEVSSTVYWREPFGSIGTPKQLQQYIVMDCDIVKNVDRRSFAGQGTISHKYELADVWLVRANELGTSGNQYHCRTHLGTWLNPGDTVLAFDLANANINDKNFDKLKSTNLPDVIIVKKYYERTIRNRRRRWKLKHLHDEVQGTAQEDKDYNEFLEDLEENPDIRQNVNIYKDSNKIAVDTDETDDEDIPRITLQEMMDDLNIEDEEMGGDEASNAPMN